MGKNKKKPAPSPSMDVPAAAAPAAAVDASAAAAAPAAAVDASAGTMASLEELISRAWALSIPEPLIGAITDAVASGKVTAGAAGAMIQSQLDSYGSPRGAFTNGDVACVHGLNGRPDLNAEHCVLTAFHDEAGRWAVRFTSGEEVRIKTANLKHPTPPMPTVTLLDLGHDMHAALVQSVGITYGLPALCAVAASHRLLAEACRRDDVWRGLLKHELGITTRPMHVVAPTEQPASGSPCIAMMRALRRQPRKLVAHMAKPAHARPVVRGLSATFPVLPRGRDHSVRADVPLPLVAKHTS